MTFQSNDSKTLIYLRYNSMQNINKISKSSNHTIDHLCKLYLNDNCTYDYKRQGVFGPSRKNGDTYSPVILTILAFLLAFTLA